MRPLFYEHVVPLSKERHRDWSIEPLESFEFTRNTNSIFIAAVEFSRIAREYPIVFGKNAEGNAFPVALLGLTPGQNLFLDGNGAWLGSYIPAYVRRYPFIVASDPETGKKHSSLTVCIDESYSGFNQSGRGNALFLDTGDKSAILTQAIEFIKEFNQHLEFTNVFCERLDELGLLEEMQATVKLADGNQHTMSGFMGINRERLKKLKPRILTELLRNDYLELIYAQLQSLVNLDYLGNRVIENNKTSVN